MRAVIQRVTEASVKVDGNVVGAIGAGLLVLVGVEDADTQEDVQWLAAKIVSLRIFGDEAGLMNRSLRDVDGGILAISQFTLHAATKKGARPSFIRAARPDVAIPLYEAFVRQLEAELGKKVETGRFGADMEVFLLNDGPVTIIIDTQNKE
ncbi:D-aminoacyl-tRNA deacylase [Flaviaesturariibacter terrae]